MTGHWKLLLLPILFLLPTTVNAQSGTALLWIQGDWQQAAGGRSLSQQSHFANDAVSFGLSYDIVVADDLPPNQCTSHWWAWTTGYITLGMTAPIQANWYTRRRASPISQQK